MAVVLDEGARRAIVHRRAHHHDSRILLYVEPLRGRIAAAAPYHEILTPSWASGHRPRRPLVARQVGNVTVIMEKRVARYTQWNDLTISAWRLGPIDRLTIDPGATLDMHEWERAHPDPDATLAVTGTTRVAAGGVG